MSALGGHSHFRINRSVLLKILFATFLLLVGFRAYLSQTPVRIINIRVAFDEEFQFQRSWNLTLRRILQTSSAKFGKHFGIKFHVAHYEKWKSNDSLKRVYDLINDLRKKVPLRKCDIVVGFTGQWTKRGDISGAAIYLHNYVIVKRMNSEQLMSTALTHELCHLFGGVDLHQIGSIMDMENIGQDFDAFTTQLVLLNKDRHFIPHIYPLNKDKWDEAINLYKERKRLNRKEDDLNVILATLYNEMGEYDQAVAECLEFLEVYPHSAEIHNLLGIAYRRKGELERAIEEYKKVLDLDRKSVV